DNDPTFNLAANGGGGGGGSSTISTMEPSSQGGSLLGTENNNANNSIQESNKVTAAHFPSLNSNLTVQSINNNGNNGNNGNDSQHQSMALVQKSYIAANGWENNNHGNNNHGNALQVANVRYMQSAADAVYGNRSKVP